MPDRTDKKGQGYGKFILTDEYRILSSPGSDDDGMSDTLVLGEEFRVSPKSTTTEPRNKGLEKLVLTPADRIFPTWDYDIILDGLISGKISGMPLNKAEGEFVLKMLQSLDWSPSARQLAGSMPYLVERLTMRDLRSLMNNLGYNCQENRLSGRQLAVYDKAATVVTLDGEFWQFERLEGARTALVRPAPNGIGIERRQVRPFQTYNTLFCKRTHRLAEQEMFAKHRSFVADLFAAHHKEGRLLILLTFLTGLLTVMFSLAVIFLFNLVVSGQQPHVIFAVLIGVSVIFLADCGFRSIKSQLLGRIAGRTEYWLGAALFDKLMRLPRKMIEQAPIGEQTVRLRELEGLRDLFSSPFTTVLLELPVTLVLIGVIAAFSTPLALFLVGAILFFLVLGTCLVPSVVRGAADLSAARRVLTQLQMEAIERQDVLSRNGLAWPWNEKAQRAASIVVSARFRLARRTALLETVSYLSVPASVTTVIFLGALQVISGNLTGGVLIAATMLTWRALAPIQQGLLLIPKAKDLLRLFRQIDTMMRFPSREELPEIGKTHTDLQPLRASNVVLRGTSSELPALAGVSLTVPAGMLAAVGGASGAGKSALLGVLAGQILPQAGSVWFGSSCLTEMSSSILGRRIVLVPARAPLIYGTLAQNLRFADPLADDAAIEGALREVGLRDLIEKLPRGINERIDPVVDTALLSGGVRTAVAVAQALLISPAVLMVDEAAEDNDPEIEAAIFEAFKRRRGEMTTLLVTHRPSLIRACDGLIEVANGRASFRNLEQVQDLAG